MFVYFLSTSHYLLDKKLPLSIKTLFVFTKKNLPVVK